MRRHYKLFGRTLLVREGVSFPGGDVARLIFCLGSGGGVLGGRTLRLERGDYSRHEIGPLVNRRSLTISFHGKRVNWRLWNELPR